MRASERQCAIQPGIHSFGTYFHGLARRMGCRIAWCRWGQFPVVMKVHASPILENAVVSELECPPRSCSPDFEPPVCHCYLSGNAIPPGCCPYLQCLYREYCSNSRVLRDELNEVRCEEVKHECPVDIKHIIKGDHNVVQHRLVKLSMGCIVSRIWTAIQKGKPKEFLCEKLGEKTTMVCNTQRASRRRHTFPLISMCAEYLCSLCRTLRGNIGDL